MSIINIQESNFSFCNTANKVRVFIPTYRRLNQFRWSLRSTLLAGLRTDLETTLTIISNDPESHNEVKKIVQSELGESDPNKKWRVDIIERKKTVDPVDNWYSAILEYSQQGDVVFLHGDDDIYFPHGIELRAKAIIASSSVISISRTAGQFSFLDDVYCCADNLPKEFPLNSRPLALNSEGIKCATFIGNHAYLFGNEFKESLQLAYQWCEEQTWLTRNERTLMLPYYLPIAALHLKFPCLEILTPCEIRGMEYDESANSPYGSRSWNPYFLYGATLDILNNKDLLKHSELDADRNWHSKHAALGLFTYFFDNRISKNSRSIWMKQVLHQIHTKDYAYSILGVGYLFNFLTGRRTRRLMLQKSLKARVMTSEFIDCLQNL